MRRGDLVSPAGRFDIVSPLDVPKTAAEGAALCARRPQSLIVARCIDSSPPSAFTSTESLARRFQLEPARLLLQRPAILSARFIFALLLHVLPTCSKREKDMNKAECHTPLTEARSKCGADNNSKEECD